MILSLKFEVLRLAIRHFSLLWLETLLPRAWQGYAPWFVI